MGDIKQLFNRHWFIKIVLGFQLFRLVLLPFMGLMPQDAYYYFYGQHLALSYFDHPGMIAYALRLFTTIFGTYPFVVKLADFTLTSFTLYSFYRLSGYFLSKQRQQLALVLYATTILVSIVSSISTPDVPLLLFWTLSLSALHKAVFEGKKAYWLLAGLLMGFAFDSKYSAVFLQFGLLFFLILSGKYRHLLLSKWLWLCLLISVMATFPVFYWNYQHAYASFLFQSSGRSQTITQFNINFKAFFGTIAHQAFILLPVIFLTLVHLSFRYVKRALLKFKLPQSKTLFLISFLLPVFGGFFFISLFYWVKINWMMPAYITGVILTAVFIRQKWLRIHLSVSVLIHVLLAVEMIFYLVPVKSDDTWYGWHELAAKVEKLQKQYPGTFIFSDDNYKTTAELGFFSNSKIYAQNVIGEKALQYDYIGDNLSGLTGRDALFIDSDPGFNENLNLGDQPLVLNTYFKKVTQLKPVYIYKGKRPVRRFWVYHCENYRRKK